MPTLGNRLRRARERKGWSQTYVCRKLGLSNSTLSGYERDYREPDAETLSLLARLYEVSVDYLVNGTERTIDNFDKNSDNSTYNHSSRDIDQGLGDAILTGVVMVPIVAEISCGEPSYAEDDVLGYLPMGTALMSGDVKDYVFLRAKGDSMVDVDIKDGSFVLIKRQPVAENGDIVAVCVGNENATLKRIYFKGEFVVLASENPKYMPQTYHASEIRIVGKAIMVTKTL